jgi:hypothetical protein
MEVPLTGRRWKPLIDRPGKWVVSGFIFVMLPGQIMRNRFPIYFGRWMFWLGFFLTFTARAADAPICLGQTRWFFQPSTLNPQLSTSSPRPPQKINRHTRQHDQQPGPGRLRLVKEQHDHDGARAQDVERRQHRVNTDGRARHSGRTASLI